MSSPVTLAVAHAVMKTQERLAKRELSAGGDRHGPCFWVWLGSENHEMSGPMNPANPPSSVPRISLALRQLRAGFGPSIEPPRAVRELRRFVPPQLLERIDRGGRIDVGETRVSILVGGFHGTTSYAAANRSSAVFSVLCRFASALTTAIEQHGGEICELHHDGVIAVFGAGPSPTRMERRAVDAAREIAEAARKVPIAVDGSAAAAHLSIGLGVATGDAYVGGIRAGGRLYWSAVGDASNRAARLRERARRNGAALAVDSQTYEAAYEAARLSADTERQSSWIPTADADGIPEAFLLSWRER